MTRRGLAVAVAIALGALVGCGGDLVDDVDGAVDAADTVLPADTAPDSGDVASDVADDADSATPGELVLGTNEIGKNDPASFVMLEEGDPLEVQLGFQGLWMVVIAFRTRGIFDGAHVHVQATLTVEGTQQGTLELRERPLALGPEGWRYYYNFFLIVEDPTVGGSPGTVTLRVWDDAGRDEQIVREVSLTGGE